MKRRILSMTLVLCMLLTFLPTATVSAYADTDPVQITEESGADSVLHEDTAAATEASTPSTRGSHSDTDIAYAVEGGNIYFRKWAGVIVDCDDSVTSANIPAKIDGVAVTSIGPAFCDCSSLTSVTIPDSVTSIGILAFSNCSKLTSVTIPGSVSSIGQQAFEYCSSLTSVTIPDSVTSIGQSMFSGCSSLTSVTIPDSVTSIGTHAFKDCSKLTSVTIPDSVTSIGEEAFYGCSSLTGIWVDENNKYYSSDKYGVLFDKFKTTLVQLPGAIIEYTIPNSVTSIGRAAFYGCRSLTNVTIPDSVTSIGDYAFSGCSSLTSVTIPDSVTSIGQSAFSGCSSLTSVTIPDSVAKIDDYTFFYCSSLASVTIPDSVTSIDYEAFMGCDSLTSVTIPNSVTYIGSHAFADCGSLTSIWVDENNKNYSSNKYGVLFDKSKTTLVQLPGAIIEYTIPNSVTSIGHSAFYGCRSLTSVTIPDSVTSIGKEAFMYCESLTSVTIPDSVTGIDDNAFYGCSSLTNVTIPNSVTNFGEVTFAYCVNLTSVTISDGVTSIGNYAFYGCRSLTSVTIPSSVTSIGNYAFNDCSNLTSVYFYGDAPENGWRMVDSSKTTLYYIDGKEGWTIPTWNGYPTTTWIPEHEHNYSAVVIAPTCTEQGYTTHACNICCDSYKDTYVAAKGHTYKNGECTVCGAVDPTYSALDSAVVFKDVGQNDWYKSAVDYAINHKLFNGTSPSTFDPESPMTRAMLVTVLWRSAGEPVEGTNNFSDVPNDQYYAQPVAWAAANGIVTGTSPTTFEPDENVTREQLATILYRYTKKLGVDVSASGDLTKFSDHGKANDWALDALKWAVGAGIISGDRQGNTVYLDPQGNATRAQVATIFMRYLENVVK